MFKVMKITHPFTDEIFWLDGHNEDEAHASFGNGIEITKLVAVPEDQVMEKKE